ncbi:MAG TPA: MarR family transcriptional regulator [Rhizomicrobium sp.]|nr:MarR family transcriptional regulator [Rhizomicrobium sp.]
MAEWGFMRALYDARAMLPSALALKMGMTKGAISKLADRLLAKGLIVRSDSVQDKRAHSLSLTKDGRAKVPLLASLADHNDAEYFSVLTNDEHEHLLQTLKTLAERRGITSIPLD